MPTPRFSIVIPTRNGIETLRHALRTCLAQRFDSFEVVVSDNNSQPETRQVVESFGSDRIRYIRSDVLLPMRENWELAVGNAHGEYVIVIGDDDALLPDALANLDSFIATTGARAIRWSVVSYTWPDVKGGWVANKIHIPFSKPTKRIDSRQAILSVLEGAESYSHLPMLYYSAIHHSLINELKARTGKVFKGIHPDIYSAFAIGYIAKEHYMLGTPLAVVGYSSKSNGVATLAVKEQNAISEEFHALNSAAGFLFQDQIPNIPAIAAAVATEFLQAKELLFPQDAQFILDRKQLVSNCIKDLETNDWFESDVWSKLMKIIRDSLRDDPNLLEWFDRTYPDNYEPKERPWIFSLKVWREGFSWDSLCLDAKYFGISDVFDAAELSGRLFGQSFAVSHDLHVDSTFSLRRGDPHLEGILEGLGRMLWKNGMVFNYPLLRSIRRWQLEIHRAFLPKLGVLFQHPARPLKIPGWYVQGRASSAKSAPSISVVTPSLNQGKFIERTMQSVLQQNYHDFEYMIQDGGSLDATPEILRRHEDRLTRIESRKDNGQSHALNLGFENSRGEIMSYLNSDDLMMPGAMNYVGDYFNRHPDVDVIYSHRVIVDETDREIGRWVLPPHDREVLLWADFIPQETMFWRRRIWEKVGGYVDESFQFAMDWDLLLRFQAAGAVIHRVPRFLAAFRVHGAQKTSQYLISGVQEEISRLRRQNFGRDVTNEEIAQNIRHYLEWSVIYHQLYWLKLHRA